MTRQGGEVSAPPILSAYTDRQTRVLLSVCAGSTLYAEIIDDTGYARSTIHACLWRLRRSGLVTWDPGKKGTIRPLVMPHTFGSVTPSQVD